MLEIFDAVALHKAIEGNIERHASEVDV